MYILEILMNSIHVDSKEIICTIDIDTNKDEILIIIEDDGKGMDEDMLSKVTDPFVTSRNTRKIGLGVALLDQLSKQVQGDLTIKSRPSIGTMTICRLPLSHIDLPPMGDIGKMMMYCIQADKDIDLTLSYRKDDHTFLFATKTIKEILGEVSIDEPSILLWIRDHINENIQGE